MAGAKGNRDPLTFDTIANGMTCFSLDFLGEIHKSCHLFPKFNEECTSVLKKNSPMSMAWEKPERNKSKMRYNPTTIR